MEEEREKKRKVGGQRKKGRRKRGAKLSAFFKDRRKNDHGRPKAKEISLKIRNAN